MATYCNQHWLLSHIRNSFISTDESGMCETVMLSDDMPKHFLRKYQANDKSQSRQQNNKSIGSKPQSQHTLDLPLQEVDFVCYPGLDQSDDEDMDLTTQSFEIQMFPEIGAHRFRSNTAQKLEKMDLARRKAAKIKSVNYDDDVVPPERSDFFVKKAISHPVLQNGSTNQGRFDKGVDVTDDAGGDSGTASTIKSKLALQLANSPKQAQNKFMEYARFDGTYMTGIQTKSIHVFLSMLPDRDRNYPIKICVLASAKIIEVIGLVCYKATIQYPEIPLKSIRHYALYMKEDGMEDFPPLDNREPCSKFGFSHLKLAERRPLAQVIRVDYANNLATKSMTSEDDKARVAAAAVRSIQEIYPKNGEGGDEGDSNCLTISNNDDYEERLMTHNDMLEAPMYRTYRLNIIEKPFFKTEVTLGISGDRIEIDQHKNAKFWSKQKAVTYTIDAVAYCEIIEKRNLKATLRIWLKSSSSSSTISSRTNSDLKSTTHNTDTGIGGGVPTSHSPSNTDHHVHVSSPFGIFSTSSSCVGNASNHHNSHMRFKHYDFEADSHTAEHILNKLSCILKMKSSEVRREFLQSRERKLERSQAKKHLKM
ncbi:stress-activated map kinase-interacting protein 1 [Eurosta solidaginis]|uniref:stress-activated map kinase-interacting protein 1 n=1 Tax=Eurosta solidaginis TaxID=178769 RepID=UPI0035316C04